jgi:glycosyltransferase involved in cell wall biosynthesis
MVPRTDFEVMSEQLHGRILHPGASTRPVALVENAARLDLSQAVRARRARPSAYISLSERVGIPLSLLRPTAPHVLVAHLLTSSQKRMIERVTSFLWRTDLTLVFARPQHRYLLDEVGLEPQRARFIWDKVDHRFYTPPRRVEPGRYVVSVGREQRDYATLIDALRDAPIPCVIVPGSSWSHRSIPSLEAPEHIQIRSGLSYSELRDLYRGARLVAVPVNPGTDYAAGVNGVLEGMACGRPVVASDTPGLAGYVRDGQDGRTVRAGDPTALRAVIEELWEDGAEAERLGDAGRDTVERERTIEHFTRRVAESVESLA